MHALATLRYLNNNPILSYLAKGGGAPGKKRKKSERDGSISNSPRPRLIVEFTVEDYSKVLRCIPPPPPPPPSVNIYSPVCVCRHIVCLYLNVVVTHLCSTMFHVITPVFSADKIATI